ncbi:MAG TPA: pentapeptide repeat-containing protein [Abditibacteriaceae bacterium]|jgi:uncharacterized protein YjbI with pentapeptide repeats
MKFVDFKYRPAILWLGLVLIILTGAYAFLQFFSLSSSVVEPEDKRIGVIIESWKAIGQFVAAVVVGIGLYWTARNVRVAEDNVEVARKNAEIARTNSEVTERTSAENLLISQGNLEATRDGKLAERYSKAIDLLAKRNDNKIDTVSFLGGVYALERIARESPKDHWAIMELLLTIARQEIELKRSEEKSTRWISREVQSVLTVLGRRQLNFDNFAEGYSDPALKERVIQLGDLIIQGASFRSLRFSNAWFVNTEFHNCDFRGAQLQDTVFQRAKFYDCIFGDLSQKETTICNRADFLGSTFEDSYLINTNFTDCVLVGCKFGPRPTPNIPLDPNDAFSVDLTGVNFTDAKLAGAYFVPGSELINVNFERANLKNTQLRGVNISQANNLTPEQLKEAWT